MWLKCFTLWVTTVKPATLAAQPMSKSKSSMGLPAFLRRTFSCATNLVKSLSHFAVITEKRHASARVK